MCYASDLSVDPPKIEDLMRSVGNKGGRLIAYKWMRTDITSLWDCRYLFKWGWNIEEGEKGGVCCAGGFHIVDNPIDFVMIPPEEVFECYKVYYRKCDILGRGQNKMRVRAFKLLKKN